MSAALYAELLRVKRLREQSAETALRAAEAERDACRKAAQQAHEAADDYHGFRLSEETRLFEEIRMAEVHVRDIDDMKRKRERMREREDEMRAEAKTADDEADKAAKAAEAALGAHVEAQRAVVKFEEFVAEAERAEADEAARREDAAAEEITEAVFGGRRGTGAVE